ncbi:hypothetical protein WICPIJ_002521 [Wickerhamomyces pijperi]|uniref:Uncharacterized protein n=1 Tax=Wickerhamomyces pijperi TaxID=599730 RepID=A0A9P8QBN4_WICPI|nr:hypothetical protein WICPIJ_002521 [Wickerhamomyces pijperi]
MRRVIVFQHIRVSSTESSPPSLQKPSTTEDTERTTHHVIIVSTATSTLNSGTNTPNKPPVPTPPAVKARRLDVEPISSEMLRILGMELWVRYQRILNLFIIGKRSRVEFQQGLETVFEDAVNNQTSSTNDTQKQTDTGPNSSALVVPSDTMSASSMIQHLKKLHNQLLLLNLSNALREPPTETYQATSNFTMTRRLTDPSQANNALNSQNPGKNKSKSGKSSSSQYERLKKTVMSLPIRERYRIKSITRDSGKRSMANSSLTLTRQAMLPKTPYRNPKDQAQAQAQANGAMINGTTPTAAQAAQSAQAAEWTHDISNGYQAPLSIETYTLPDADNLTKRMLGIAREHGLMGSVDKDAVELVSLGLEDYLKGILEAGIESVRFRRRKWEEDDDEEEDEQEATLESRPMKKRKKITNNEKITLTSEDIIDTLQISPFLVEPCVPLYQLHSVRLKDDCYIEEEGREAYETAVAGSSAGVKTEAVSNGGMNRLKNGTLSSANNTPITSPVTIKKEVQASIVNSPLKMGATSVNSSASSSPLVANKSLELDNKVNEGTKEELRALIGDLLKAGANAGWHLRHSQLLAQDLLLQQIHIDNLPPRVDIHVLGSDEQDPVSLPHLVSDIEGHEDSQGEIHFKEGLSIRLTAREQSDPELPNQNQEVQNNTGSSETHVGDTDGQPGEDRGETRKGRKPQEHLVLLFVGGNEGQQPNKQSDKGGVQWSTGVGDRQDGNENNNVHDRGQTGDTGVLNSNDERRNGSVRGPVQQSFVVVWNKTANQSQCDEVSAADIPINSVPAKEKAAVTNTEQTPLNPLENAPGWYQYLAPMYPCPFGAPPQINTIPKMKNPTMATIFVTDRITSDSA